MSDCRTFFRKSTVCGFLRKSLHCAVHKCISRSYQTVPWYFYLPSNVQTVLSRHFIQSVLCVIGPDSCNCSSYIHRQFSNCKVLFSVYSIGSYLGLVFHNTAWLPRCFLPGIEPRTAALFVLTVSRSITPQIDLTPLFIYRSLG